MKTQKTSSFVSFKEAMASGHSFLPTARVFALTRIPAGKINAIAKLQCKAEWTLDKSGRTLYRLDQFEPEDHIDDETFNLSTMESIGVPRVVRLQIRKAGKGVTRKRLIDVLKAVVKTEPKNYTRFINEAIVAACVELLERLNG